MIRCYSPRCPTIIFHDMLWYPWYSMISYYIPRYSTVYIPFFHHTQQYVMTLYDAPSYPKIFYHILWWLAMLHDMLRYSTTFHHITPLFTDIQLQSPIFKRGFIIFNDGPWYSFICDYILSYAITFHNIRWYYIILYNIPRCFIMLYNIQRSSIIFCDVLQRSMRFLDIPWSRDIPWYSAIFQHIMYYFMILKAIPLYSMPFANIPCHSSIFHDIPS